MATITPKEKDGKIIAFKFRTCVGRDKNGNAKTAIRILESKDPTITPIGSFSALQMEYDSSCGDSRRRFQKSVYFL